MFKKGKHPRLPVSVSQIRLLNVQIEIFFVLKSSRLWYFLSRSSELLEYEYELELGEEKILPDITFAGKSPEFICILKEVFVKK